MSNHTSPVLLLIDTATPVCSLALTSGQDIIATRWAERPEGGSSAHAGAMAEELLNEARQRELTLDAIALSAGPGSYTGLRIGSALAKGLCHGFGIPLIAISTLELMAHGYLQGKTLGRVDLICPMIDARRDEVYTARFSADGTRLSEDAPLILSEGILGKGEAQHYHLCGDGAEKAKGIDLGGSYSLDGSFRPRAEYMLVPALQAFEAQAFVDLAYWTPCYLKEYVATISKNKVLG